MTRIVWGSPGAKTLETGVDRGVFYPQEGPGVPWDGIISIKEDPTGTDVPTKFVDGVPYRSQKTREGFAVMLQAMTCPQEFEAYEGTPHLRTRQTRKAFGLSYRTQIVNDTQGMNYGYKIHLVYNALAMPSNVDFSTITNDRLDATPFSWGISTTPIPIPGAQPAAHLIIDSTIAYPEALQAIENVLYGSGTGESRLPDPDELFDLFEQHAILVIIDHADGTWSAVGPSSAISMLDANTFQISWPSAVYLDADNYQISSL